MSVEINEYTTHYWYCSECDCSEDYDSEGDAIMAALEHREGCLASEEDDE